MRAILVLTLVGLVAQALAEAPQPVYAPAQEYAAPVEATVAEKLPTGYSVQSGYEGYLVPNTEGEIQEVAEVEEEGGKNFHQTKYDKKSSIFLISSSDRLHL